MTTKTDTAVTGRRFLRAVAFAVAGAVIAGTAGYLVLHRTPLDSAMQLQLVVLLVYAMLFLGLCSQFRSIAKPPIALHPSGGRDALLAAAVLIGTLGVVTLAYFCLGFVFGNPHDIAAQITARATDARRLQGARAEVWIIAIARGCLLVPLFEETLFRGLLLSWLKQHMRTEFAILLMAAVFTAMHGAFIVIPYTFLFAVVLAWVRKRTGSLFNCVLIHSVNNVFLLVVGLRIHGG